jgi:hypothetical protein
MDKQTAANRRKDIKQAKQFASSMTGVPESQIKRGSHPVAGPTSRKTPAKGKKAK